MFSWCLLPSFSSLTSSSLILSSLSLPAKCSISCLLFYGFCCVNAANGYSPCTHWGVCAFAWVIFPFMLLLGSQGLDNVLERLDSHWTHTYTVFFHHALVIQADRVMYGYTYGSDLFMCFNLSLWPCAITHFLSPPQSWELYFREQWTVEKSRDSRECQQVRYHMCVFVFNHSEYFIGGF